MPSLIGDKAFGDGQVRLAFNGPDGTRLKPGTMLTQSQIIAMKNHRSLIRSEYIAVFPPRTHALLLGEPKRFVIHNGGGKHDVIVGHKMNDEPLARDEAEALAKRSD